jgi:hypothetical protein
MKNVTYLALTAMMAVSLMGCSVEADSSGELAEAANPAPEAAPAAAPKPKDVYQPAPRITIPAGSKLRVSLIDGLSTDNSSSGDQFLASLADPVVVDGKTLLEKGTKVRGRVVDVAGSGRVKGVASISLILTDIVKNDKNIAISTKTFAAEAETTKKRDAGIVAGAAGAGAVIGAIADGKKGAGLGALLGGGAGTGAVLATKGEELRYPPETRLTFTLDTNVSL